LNVLTLFCLRDVRSLTIQEKAKHQSEFLIKKQEKVFFNYAAAFDIKILSQFFGRFFERDQILTARYHDILTKIAC